MNTTLYRHEVDDDGFAELRQAPGQRGLKTVVMAANAEPRLPAAAQGVRRALLVVFRLGADAGTTEWSISFNVLDAQGHSHTVRQRLMDEPMDGNVAERPLGDPSTPMPPGLIYRGAFWVNLDPLVDAYHLSGGTVLKLRYGNGVPVELTLPN
jgi:hypothetical protein